MKTNLPILAVVALALAGCASAQTDASRTASTTAAEHHAVGNTANSIDEVRDALEREEVRAKVYDSLDVLLSKSEGFETSFELERDLFVCEQIHPIPADHEPDHPESKPLASCVLHTFETHQVGQS